MRFLLTMAVLILNDFELQILIILIPIYIIILIYNINKLMNIIKSFEQFNRIIVKIQNAMNKVYLFSFSFVGSAQRNSMGLVIWRKG